MTPAEMDLARALVAAPWWEWRPGMLVLGHGYGPWTPTGRHWVTDRAVRLLDAGSPHLDHAVPDLRDPATQGCLLAMLPIETLTYRTSADGETWQHWSGLAWRVPGEVPAGSVGEMLARALLAVRP